MTGTIYHGRLRPNKYKGYNMNGLMLRKRWIRSNACFSRSVGAYKKKQHPEMHFHLPELHPVQLHGSLLGVVGNVRIADPRARQWRSAETVLPLGAVGFAVGQPRVHRGRVAT